MPRKSRRLLAASAAAAGLMLLAAMPLLFDRPPSTIQDRGTLVSLAASVSHSDSMSDGWTEESLNGAAADFCPGLSLGFALEDSLAVGQHTLYPFDFLTVRSRCLLVVALRRPWPGLPARRLPGLLESEPRQTGRCLVYVLRERA